MPGYLDKYQLLSDTFGVLFEDFPDDEAERRNVTYVGEIMDMGRLRIE